jgi:hypothetical protein
LVEEEEDEVVWPHPRVWMVQLVENGLPVAGVKTSPIYICKSKCLPANGSRDHGSIIHVRKYKKSKKVIFKVFQGYLIKLLVIKSSFCSMKSKPTKECEIQSTSALTQ